MADGSNITVEGRTPFTDKNGYTGETVLLNNGHSFQSWDVRSYGDGPVLAKDDWVTVIDGSDSDTKGEKILEGKIISLRDSSVWVYNPETEEAIFSYPHRDKIIKSPPPKPV